MVIGHWTVPVQMPFILVKSNFSSCKLCNSSNTQQSLFTRNHVSNIWHSSHCLSVCLSHMPSDWASNSNVESRMTTWQHVTWYRPGRSLWQRDTASVRSSTDHQTRRQSSTTRPSTSTPANCNTQHCDLSLSTVNGNQLTTTCCVVAQR